MNNVDKEKTIEPVEVFKHLKSLNLFEGNIKSLSDLENTVIGKLINKKVDQHNNKAKNTLNCYSIWAAVIYRQKDVDVENSIGRTQHAMTIASKKIKVILQQNI